jgi:hypothetical protein
LSKHLPHCFDFLLSIPISIMSWCIVPKPCSCDRLSTRTIILIQFGSQIHSCKNWSSRLPLIFEPSRGTSNLLILNRWTSLWQFRIWRRIRRRNSTTLPNRLREIDQWEPSGYLRCESLKFNVDWQASSTRFEIPHFCHSSHDRQADRKKRPLALIIEKVGINIVKCLDREHCQSWSDDRIDRRSDCIQFMIAAQDWAFWVASGKWSFPGWATVWTVIGSYENRNSWELWLNYHQPDRFVWVCVYNRIYAPLDSMLSSPGMIGDDREMDWECCPNWSLSLIIFRIPSLNGRHGNLSVLCLACRGTRLSIFSFPSYMSLRDRYCVQ